MAQRKSGSTATTRGSRTKAAPAPASTTEASGAVIEPAAAKLPIHPAVESNPRADATPDQVRQDFNDPTLSQEEAVEANLKAQG